MPPIDQIDRRTDVVILLFYIANKIEGVTKLQKLLFLIEEETDFFKKYEEKIDINFEAYKMGPFSQEVYEEVEFLLNIGMIEKRPMAYDSSDSYEVRDHIRDDGSEGLSNKVFVLTEKGEKAGKKLEEVLEDKYFRELEDIVSRYGKLPLSDLLEYVYENYEAYTTESTIREQVLG